MYSEFRLQEEDAVKTIIDEINKKRNYNVLAKSEKEEVTGTVHVLETICFFNAMRHKPVFR
jgi:hypothetical protein